MKADMFFQGRIKDYLVIKEEKKDTKWMLNL